MDEVFLTPMFLCLQKIKYFCKIKDTVLENCRSKLAVYKYRDVTLNVNTQCDRSSYFSHKVLSELTQDVQLENIYIYFYRFVRIDFTHLISDHKQGYQDYSHHGIVSSCV